MLFLTALLLAPPSHAHDGHPQLVLDSWERELVAPAFGTRWAAIVEVADEDPISVEVYDGREWREAKEIFRIRNRVLIQTDLWEAANRVLIHSPDQDRIEYMEWDLVNPVNEPKGPPQPPAPGVLPQEYKDMGVITRQEWGARPTTCVETEDDWYRMAIHHTAGHQETGGSEAEQVKWLQVFFQETRGYCDIGYQFLVGRDGSIWEGRPYDYYAAATGGGQNNGNMAISFMGCYDTQACASADYPGPHTFTDTMANKGHELVWTIAEVEDIPTDADHIKGHNDWPGNNTACPGDQIEDRIPTWFSPPGPAWAAEFDSSTFALSEEAPIVLEVGETLSGTMQFVNTGTKTWTEDTVLAPLPRDTDSDVYGEDWISANRVAAVADDTEPGETGSFNFSLAGRTEGVYYQEFGLVQEGVSWFDDSGGMDPSSITLRIVVAAAGDTGPFEDTGDLGEETKAGCGCSSSPRSPASLLGLIALVGALVVRRR